MDNNFVTDALTLTMFGMGFVFVFLALMVVVTKVMSLLVAKIQPTSNNTSALDSDPITEIDEKTRAIIEAAIKMHTQR
ncbi:OadG family protein [Candidatus Pseudothioglobus sp. Uisw_050_01]|uniref:OadG family protein n=1 Tax=Candidatus Pseudothioglobus sp. Uisw_050_01 TaxID=3230997 RepID=UPI003A85A6C1